MTLTWPKRLFAKKTSIFSNTVDSTDTKIFKTDVKYRCAMKPSYFSKE